MTDDKNLAETFHSDFNALRSWYADFEAKYNALKCKRDELEAARRVLDSKINAINIQLDSLNGIYSNEYMSSLITLAVFLTAETNRMCT